MPSPLVPQLLNRGIKVRVLHSFEEEWDTPAFAALERIGVMTQHDRPAQSRSYPRPQLSLRFASRSRSSPVQAADPGPQRRSRPAARGHLRRYLDRIGRAQRRRPRRGAAASRPRALERGADGQRAAARLRIRSGPRPADALMVHRLDADSRLQAGVPAARRGWLDAAGSLHQPGQALLRPPVPNALVVAPALSPPSITSSRPVRNPACWPARYQNASAISSRAPHPPPGSPVDLVEHLPGVLGQLHRRQHGPRADAADAHLRGKLQGEGAAAPRPGLGPRCRRRRRITARAVDGSRGQEHATAVPHHVAGRALPHAQHAEQVHLGDPPGLRLGQVEHAAPDADARVGDDHRRGARSPRARGPRCRRPSASPTRQLPARRRAAGIPPPVPGYPGSPRSRRPPRSAGPSPARCRWTHRRSQPFA